MSSRSWSDFIIYAAISHYHCWYILLVVIFSASSVNPDILCVIRCLHSDRKCSNVTDPMNFQISSYRTALTKIYFIIKSGDASLPKSTGCERYEAASDWYVSSSGTERYWMALISGVDVSRSPCLIRAIGGHFEYSPWHMLAKNSLTVIN